ncbi:hypothetical protein Cfor_02114, partial [Coptotermes formosanus]
ASSENNFGFLHLWPPNDLFKTLRRLRGSTSSSKACNTIIWPVLRHSENLRGLVLVREAGTPTTVKGLKEKLFSSFSVPEVLVSDNGRCFTVREFKQFCFEMGIKYVTTSTYYPQPSHAGRFNRNILAALIVYHGQHHRNWNHNLTWFQLAFKDACKSFGVLFPFRAVSPLMNRWNIRDLMSAKCSKRHMVRKWDAVRQNLNTSPKSVANRYNNSRILSLFRVGDLVNTMNHPVSHAGREFAAKLSSL